jgi:hypothetical protein
MLVIRTKQMQALAENMRKGFEDRMASHLAKRFHDRIAMMDELSIRESIRKGIERAASYGVSTEYDVARYIELMYMFTEDFDTSSDTPWAGLILEDPNMDSRPKMNELWDRAHQETRSPGSQSMGRS